MGFIRRVKPVSGNNLEFNSRDTGISTTRKDSFRPSHHLDKLFGHTCDLSAANEIQSSEHFFWMRHEPKSFIHRLDYKRFEHSAWHYPSPMVL